MPREISLGIDLGTSSLKIVALDMMDGCIVAEAGAAYPLYCGSHLQAEQDPADWLMALRTAMKQVMDHLQQSGFDLQVYGIGLTGQIPTLVALDGSATVGRAITWMDGRADDYVSEFLSHAQRAAIYRQTGMVLDGRYIAPMATVHLLHRGVRNNKVLSAKDYICYRLIGSMVTDPSTAAGYGLFNVETRSWDKGMCDLWKIQESLLPEVMSSTAMAGSLSDEGSALLGLPAGVPVFTGAADSVAASYALSGGAPGVVSVICGSSTVIMDVTPQINLDKDMRYLLTPHVTSGLFGREMDLLASGSGHAWLASILNWSSEQLVSGAASSPPGALGLFFSPYLAGGEQGALWDPTLRSTLFGLTSEHTAGDIARALMEGTQYETVRCIDVLREKHDIHHIMMTGGSREDTVTPQILADIAGVNVTTVPLRSAAALGAALLVDTDGLPRISTDRDQRGYCPGESSGRYMQNYREYLQLFPKFSSRKELR